MRIMVIKMCDKCKGFDCFRNKALHVGIGILVAVIIGVTYVLWLFVSSNDELFGTEEASTLIPENMTRNTYNLTGNANILASSESVSLRKPLYMGIMTMERYINTRAAMCNRTWGQNPVISKLEFFASLPNDHEMANYPDIVKMPATKPDDIYRTEETFTMLQHVCDTHIDAYDWFVRAVDDCYIRPDKLLNTLSFVDKRKKIYAGHPVQATTDKTAEQHDTVYCLGGPGIILSRRALKGLCPHLKKCKREFKNNNADEQLGRCVNKYIGLECTKSQKFKEYFYNSNERNIISLYEDMLRQDYSLTLHPLKSPWMMDALHQHYVKNSIKSLSQRLEDTKVRLERLKSYSKANHTYSTVPGDSRFTISTERNPANPVSVISNSMIQYNSHGCKVKKNASSAQVNELRQAIVLSNSSFRWGDMINCHTLLGATYQANKFDTAYTVHLKCNKLLNTSRQSLASAHLQRCLLSAEVTRIRDRALGSKLVALLPVYYSDPDVLDFLFMWNNLLYHKSIEDFILVLLIMEPPGEKTRNKSVEDSYLIARVENTLKDLSRWSADNNIHVRTYYLNKTVRHHKIQKKILHELKEENENSVILFAKPNLKFDEMFLYKCRTFVRPGKQIYRPYALRRDEDINSIRNFLWTSAGSPLCIHLTDLLNINYRKKPKNSGSQRRKPIKIIYSYDDTVEIKTS